jgi:septal ring factor EnvC (AmiA/AmiB activator)
MCFALKQSATTTIPCAIVCMCVSRVGVCTCTTQQELMAELRGDLTKDQIKRLERKVQDGEQRNRDLLTQSEQATKVMNELEEVFRQLQQVRWHSTHPACPDCLHASAPGLCDIHVCACGR